MEPIQIEAKLTERVQELEAQIEKAITDEVYEVAESLTDINSSYTGLAKVFVNLAVFLWKQEEDAKALNDEKIADLIEVTVQTQAVKIENQAAIILEKDTKIADYRF